MAKLKENKKKDIKRLKEKIEKEFPDDISLQQIHIARKLISIEAEKENLTYIQWIKLKKYKK